MPQLIVEETDIPVVSQVTTKRRKQKTKRDRTSTGEYIYMKRVPLQI